MMPLLLSLFAATACSPGAGQPTPEAGSESSSATPSATASAQAPNDCLAKQLASIAGFEFSVSLPTSTSASRLQELRAAMLKDHDLRRVTARSLAEALQIARDASCGTAEVAAIARGGHPTVLATLASHEPRSEIRVLHRYQAYRGVTDVNLIRVNDACQAQARRTFGDNVDAGLRGWRDCLLAFGYTKADLPSYLANISAG